MSAENSFNPFAAAQAEFDRIADLMGLEKPVRDLLRTPAHEHRLTLPVRLDDGNVEVFHEDNPPGKTIHEMGTARMGRDPATSVLNGFNQSHDVPNLFVVDGSCMVSSANQNPSLTYMALTARACAYAVDALNRLEL